jgi:hypothetical protein
MVQRSAAAGVYVAIFTSAANPADSERIENQLKHVQTSTLVSAARSSAAGLLRDFVRASTGAPLAASWRTTIPPTCTQEIRDKRALQAR